MFRALQAKAAQYPYIKELLCSTADHELLGTWKDSFWGWNEGTGLNIYGKLLGQVRDSLSGSRHRVRYQSLRAFEGTTTRDYAASPAFHGLHLDGAPVFAHFTRDVPWRSASDTLHQILQSCRVEPSPRPTGVLASCWRLTSISRLRETYVRGTAELLEQTEQFLRPGFGIAIPYEYGRELGLVPAIAWEPSELDGLPQHAHYRVQFFSPTEERDWTHDLEWRFPSTLHLRPDLTTVLVPSARLGEIATDRFARVVSLSN